MKKLFERKEMKYRLSAWQAKRLAERLHDDLVPDEYPDYTICSVYFDTDDWQLARKSLDKPTYKEKLRLRSYGPAKDGNSPVFLEIKKKFDGIVYKRRIDLLLKDVQPFLKNHKYETVSEKEIGVMLERMHLEPRLFVEYHRQAWTWKDDPGLRITIDDHVRVRTDDLDLRSKSEGELLLTDCILEIKSNVNFPLKLVRTLEDLDIRPASVSKSGFAYKKLLERKAVHAGTAAY